MVMRERTITSITALPAFTQKEMRNINKLLQQALLNGQLKQRLMRKDITLCAEFGLSNSVWEQLSKIRAISFAEFCGELNQLQEPSNL